MFPENDLQFEVATIKKVNAVGNGWEITKHDGWGFFIPSSSPVIPEEGMEIRFYGRGIGFVVRGVFLDGKKVFYRTEAEDKEHGQIEIYGTDAADWLNRWDKGKSVRSISMGGFGPGYEQAIQITTAEILRHLLERGYDYSAWEDQETWQRNQKEIKAAGFANKRIEALGLSGSQWGAALNLALQIYRRGPRAVMSDEQIKTRHIQVCKNFPSGD